MFRANTFIPRKYLRKIIGITQLGLKTTVCAAAQNFITLRFNRHGCYSTNLNQDKISFAIKQEVYHA